MRVNQPLNENNWTALHLACKLKEESAVYLLLMAGADPSLLTIDLQNAVHISAIASVNIFQMVLSSFKNSVAKRNALKQTDINGNTAIGLFLNEFGEEKLLNILSRFGLKDLI